MQEERKDTEGTDEVEAHRLANRAEDGQGHETEDDEVEAHRFGGDPQEFSKLAEKLAE